MTQKSTTPSIGLVIFYPFQYYVLRDIYKQLGSDAEFIVDLGAFFPVSQPASLADSIVALLQKNGVRYRVLEHAAYYSFEQMEDFFSPYVALVSLWERGCVTHKSNRDKKKICATYGAGKELTMVRPSRGYYDLILAYGPRDSKLFSYYTHPEIVGNPKFDDWFNGALSEKELTVIRSGLDPERRTVLYLPTHGDLSSVDELAQSLKHLTDEFNVIVKLHYFIAHEEPERAAMLQDPSIRLYGDDTDILPLLKVADVVVSDNSSAIFDAILADKPVVVTDFHDPDYLDFGHKERRKYRRGVNTALTFSGSIEQEIKQDGRVLSFSDPKELRSKITQALEDEEFYRQERKKLVAELFSYNDGRCGERAAKKILECIADPAPKSRPILYHAIEAYKTRIGVASYAYKYEMEGRLAAYQHRLIELGCEKDNLPTFSIIVIDTSEGLRETLRSVSWQKYPSDRYEMVVICPYPKIGDMCAYIPSQLPLKAGVRIRFEFYPDGEAISDCLAAVITSSDSEWIGFTRSGCVPGSDWLMRYRLQIGGLSYVVGIGGHEMLTPETIGNRFMRYEHHLIAKNLGTHTALRRYAWVTTVINSLPLINPFGSLSNSFYRREALLQVDIVGFGAKSWMTIETLLRWLTVKQGGLAFVPIGVPRFVGPNYASFKTDSFDRGFAHGLIRKARGRGLSQFSPREGILVVLQETIAAVSGKYARRRLGLVETALQAACFRWAGFLAARYQALVRR